MIKDIILNVSRSYTPYFPTKPAWGVGDGAYAQLDNDINSLELQPIDNSDWTLLTGTLGNGYGIKSDGTLWAWGSATDGLLGDNQSAIGTFSPVRIGTRTWVSASAGKNHVVALRSDGTLWSWGLNSSGQLGLGDLISRSSPVQIGTRNDWTHIYAGGSVNYAKNSGDNALWVWGLTMPSTTTTMIPSDEMTGTIGITDIETFNWKDISAHRSHTIGIRHDGTMWAWGVNTTGELGLGDITTRSSPVQIGTRLWNSVTTGGSETNSVLAIRDDGTLWGWGNSNSGLLGIDVNINRSSPVQVGTLNTWASASIGQFHSIALKNDGTIWISGNTMGFNRYDIKKIDNATNWVSASFDPGGGVTIGHSLTLKTDGTMWSWGSNSSGQLGSGNTTQRSSPVQIGTRSWKKINAGNQHSFAIRDDDTLWFWGNPSSGGVAGINSSILRSSPTQIGTLGWKDIKSSSDDIPHALAIRSDDTLWAWGYGNFGQLGRGFIGNESSPVQIGTRLWKKIAVGSYTSFAIRDDDTLWAWGRNSLGYLGVDNKFQQNSPVQVGTLATWIDVSSQKQTTLALQNDGTLWAWGYNYLGQVGDETTVDKSSPVQVGTETNWSSISAGNGTSTAIKTDGTLWVWGRSSIINQINTGNSIGYSSPVQVGTETNWKTVENSEFPYPLFAINTSNEMYLGPGIYQLVSTWGTPSTTFSPIQIGTDTNWAKVYAGDASSVGIKNDGTLWGWGANDWGLITSVGVQWTVDSPVQIGSDTWYSFSQIRASENYLHGGIKTDGTLWNWGYNAYGGLGINDSSTNTYLSPVQVGTLTWSELSHGREYSYAIRSDGTLWSWGRADDNFYRLGYRINLNRSSPTQIGTLTGWHKISAGLHHSTAINANFPQSSSYALFTAGGSSVGLSFPQRQIVNRSNFKINPVPIDVNSWYKIEANDTVGMGIKSDGTLWGWGSQAAGELGINTFEGRSSPVQVGTLLWNDVVVDHRSRTIAIRDDGTLWSWGLNDQYQLGDLTNINRSSPVQVGTKSDWIKASIGHFNSYAIDSSNDLWGWGGGTSTLGINLHNSTQILPVQIRTELKFRDVLAKYNNNIANFFISTGSKLYSSGDITPTQKRGIQFFGSVSPVQIISTKTNWNEISAGISHSHGIDTSGSLWGWGYSVLLGDSNLAATPSNQTSPVQIGTMTDWSTVSSGDSHAFSIKSDGTLWGWGNNSLGKIGSNDFQNITRSSPVQIGTRADWKNVSAGYFNTIAITSNGELFSWGRNLDGELGDGSKINRSSPVQVGTLNTWVSASNGFVYSAAIQNDGTLWTWGSNSRGQLGNGTVLSSSSPVQVGTDTNWYKVSAGSSYTIALKNDKTLWGWGSGLNNRLINRSAPVAVNTYQSFSIISAGASFFGITNAGILWAWGLNSSGQLGLSDDINRSSPVQVGTMSWTDVSSGGSHTMAIRNDGTLWGWGGGSQGQIGDNFATIRQSPVQIGTRADWTKISTGINTTVGVRSDGTLWAWGYNGVGNLGLYQPNPIYLTSSDYWNSAEANNQSVILKRNTDNTLWGIGLNTSGQLGLNDISFRLSPVQIGTRSWNTFSLGFNHTLSISNDGTLWAWGAGSAGQHGIALDTSIPQQVETNIKWSSVEVGARHAIAINSGSLWGWGLNNLGQLGLGDSISRSSPVQIGTETNWSSFDSGNNHTIAIKTDGTLWSWGSNNVGQLGLNLATSAHRSSPVQVGTETNWSKVFGSEAATYAIKTDGTLWVWGANDFGKLGLNLATTAHRSSPVQVGTDTNWFTVADFGGNLVSHTMAIKTNGTLWAWGSNSIGQLGLNLATSAHRSSPVQVGTRADWASVTVGNIHTIARRNDGTIWSWGSNSAGQLGLDLATSANRSSPVQIGTRAWGDIAAGASQTMAVRNDGTMWGWGLNTNRQIGDSTNVNRSSPVQIGTLSTWVSASMGEANSMLLTNDGTAYTTGIYAQGYLIDYTKNRSSPIQVGTRTWTSVSAGNTHSMGIRSDGTLWGWGLGTGGQIGDGLNISRSSPVQIGTRTWNYVSSGNSYTMAIRDDKTMWGWGLGTGGQIGDGLNISRSSPVQIGTRTWYRVADIKGSTTSHTIAIREDGTLWGWGGNSNSQLGLGKNQSVPNEIYTTLKFTDIKAGSTHGIAISTDGTIWGWGNNNIGQLGIGNTIQQVSPVQIGTSTWSKISAGSSHTMAIRSDGSLWGWGVASSGQLGNNSIINRSIPVQVGLLTDWSSVSAGSTHTAAIKTDGTMWSWGANTSGRLGLNLTTNINRSSPVQLGTETNWSKISVSGRGYNIAVKTDGTLWSWGLNSFGSLGLGDSIDRSSPVQIGTETNWSNPSDIGGDVNNAHAFAIKTDGTLWGWGRTAEGQLGLGDDVARSSPVQIGTRTDWLYAYAGDNHSMAITNDGYLWSWGIGANGRLALGDTITRSSPTQIGTLNTWVSASLGFTNSILMTNNGTVLTAGVSAEGFEARYTTPQSSPVQIGTDTNWLLAEVGNTSTMAIKTDGTLWAWGSNSNSELGVGDNITRSSPTQVGTLNTWVSASIGSNHSVLLSNDSRALTTGVDDRDFNLFNINRSSPVQIGTLTNWSSVITTTSYTMAIKNDGTLWSWGTAAFALGISTNTSRLSPVQVGTDTNWYSLAKPGNVLNSINHAVAIKTDGTLWAWGVNTGGRLGDGTEISKSSPVQIGTRTDWISATISSNVTTAIRSDRTLWSWGATSLGLLGTGDTISRSSPVQIGTDLSWVSASISDNGSLYLNSLNRTYIAGTTTNAIGFDVDFNVNRSSPIQIGFWGEWDDIMIAKDPSGNWGLGKKSDGSLWAWGDNTYGQLGQGDLIGRSSPVQVGNYYDWKRISAGGRTILGIREF